MKTITVTVVLLILVLSTPSFSQSTYATVSGTVEDPSKALIPGVTMKAVNTATGVSTTVLTNESGAYSFASLLPGLYKISAELPGFQTYTYSDVRLGSGDQIRLNFTLRVGDVATAVDVSVAADTLLATSSSSVGEIVNQQRVVELPTVTNNVLDLYRLIPGIRLTDDAGNNGVVSGLGGLGTVNITRDGVDNVGAARFGVSLQGATYMSPDLIGEVRIIVAPVDAELGRGNGQFQFMTRSGSNRFHGTGVWTVRNSAFDANTWSNNRQVDPKTGAWSPTKPDWINNHQFTASFGGPIVRNKTFFFALWDSTLMNGRNSLNPIVLTPCARNGIFRYYDSWNNGNNLQAVQATGTTPTIAVVDPVGNPMRPEFNPGVQNSTNPFTGQLRYASPFGTVLNPTTMNADCSNAQVGPAPTANGAWDQYRTQVDPTGFVTKLLGVMPQPNNWEVGDGLNTAGHRWTRNESGGSEGIFAVGPGTSALTGAGRKQINAKVDHNFNASHKVGVSYTYEDTAGNANYEPWPNGFRGRFFRHPQTLSVNFTSTLSPTLVNEARTGMRRIGGNTYNAFNNPETGEEALAFFPNYNGYPLSIGLGSPGPAGTSANNAINFQTNQVYNGTTDNYHDLTNLWSFADTLSWTRGKHAFKFGGELRLTHSLGYDAGISNTATTSIPRAIGGDAPNAQIPTTTFNATNMPGLAGNASGNNLRLRSLLSFLAGSLNQVNQFYYLQDPTKLDKFEDYLTYPERIRDTVQNEGDIFVKDDWKLTKNLTLNLGLRWEYYGVPYEAHGLMPLPVGGADAIFGISGRSFDGWMKPGARADLTQIQFVGKHSPNPGTPWYADDYNNFGPAVGFAWQVPWFGEGKTTIRGGYQMTFQQGQVPNALTQETNVPGSSYNARYTGDSSANAYLDLTKVPALVPVPNIIAPMQPVPLTDRTNQVFFPEDGVRNPYAENITLSVARSFRSNLTVEMRYIGTLGRKQWNAFFNINQANFLYNGLKEAFDAARAGDDSNPALLVLEDMFRGINVAGTSTFGPVGSPFNGVMQTAGMHLRANANTQSNLANGNYAGVAATLNTLNYIKSATVNASLPDIPAGVNGQILRNSGLFPENFIVTNPQFAAVNMIAAMTSNNYHSMEAQVTLRPTHGLGLQATYTWSRNNGTGATFTNPTNRHPDYTVLGDTRTHDFRTNGSFALPIGPNKLFFGNSSGLVARIIEGWNAGWIVNINSGAPTSVTAQSMLYANGTPDIVGPFNLKSGGVQWVDSAIVPTATYFGSGALTSDDDPQCLSITTAQNLRSLCTLNAIFDANTGEILLRNPLPGQRGTLGQRAVQVPGRWRFDANMRKLITLSESKSVEFRIDASNVLNHPEPANPTLDINSNNFGLITGAAAKSTQHRQFQAQLRLNF